MSKQFVRSVAAALMAVLALTACASYQMPARAAFHPTKSIPQQDADHSECWNFAKARTGYDPMTSAGSGAALSAILWGLVGAAAGAAAGSIGGHAGTGAAVGALAGGVGGGAIGGTTELKRMHDLFTKQYSVCMRAKSYIVE